MSHLSSSLTSFLPWSTPFKYVPMEQLDGDSGATTSEQGQVQLVCSDMHTLNVYYVCTHTVKLPPCITNTISSTVPGQVTDLLASNSSTTSLTVTWNPPTVYKGPITMYKVCVYLCVYVYMQNKYTVMECSMSEL